MEPYSLKTSNFPTRLALSEKSKEQPGTPRIQKPKHNQTITHKHISSLCIIDQIYRRRATQRFLLRLRPRARVRELADILLSLIYMQMLVLEHRTLKPTTKDRGNTCGAKAMRASTKKFWARKDCWHLQTFTKDLPKQIAATCGVKAKSITMYLMVSVLL